MFIIRKIVGSIILFLNWVFTPKGIIREADAQSTIDKKTTKLMLYQFQACPFCVKVRRAIKRMSLNIETRDAKNKVEHRQELETKGGRIKVPCLRIEDEKGDYTWMYESSAIISYLQNRFI
jgi:glutaredoxin